MEVGGIANEEVVTVQKIRFQFGCRTLLDGAEHEVGAGGVDVNAEDAAKAIPEVVSLSKECTHQLVVIGNPVVEQPMASLDG